MPQILKQRDLDVTLEYIAREGIYRMNARYELTYTNTAFLKLFGYTSIEEYNSLRKSIFGDEADETLVRSSLNAGERIIDRRVLFRTRYNGNFWGLLSCFRDEHDSCVGAVLDITSLVETEHTLRLNSDALAKSNMELDRFIYSASHDIRSPISTVMGLINLIHLETDHVRQMELVGMIGTTMTKLDTFLHQLSSHSKNARRHIEVARIELPQLLSEVVERLSDHPNFKEITIHTDAAISGDFFSDQERLSTILYDVLKNAMDFADAAKQNMEVDIHAQFVRNRMIIEIFDNGIGISEGRVSNVFDLFYKASSQSRGSGLGLYLVRETTTRLGGIVTLHSRLGVGTLVRLEIPNARQSF